MGVSTVGNGSAFTNQKVSTKDYRISGVDSRVLKGCCIPEGQELILREMTIEDYDCVRAMLPKVSRCGEWFDRKTVATMLSMETFFPFVIEVKGPEAKVIGYAELHRLPHLGRGMDGRLEKVLVLEEWRGKKIAQVACKELLDIAKVELLCGRCDLTVEKPDAMTVYKKLGFEPVDTNVWRLFF